MKKIFNIARLSLILMICLLWLTVSGQSQQQFVPMDTTAESEKYWSAWFENLYEMGVVIEKDSIKINEESKRIMIDSNFRSIIYPEKYTWEAATYFLKLMEVKKGLWYMFNLYDSDTTSKKLVLQSIVPYDKLMDMQKVMTSTFYTYALLDPKVCTYKDGKPVITRPDLVEKGFARLKEIIAYIDYYRKQEKAN